MISLFRPLSDLPHPAVSPVLGRSSWFAPAGVAVNRPIARPRGTPDFRPVASAMILAASAALTGCHTGEGQPAFMGYGATEDAKGAQIGRAVMEARGNAVDVAVAMALTMAVTTPSRAGLGGGGLCLVHDPATRAVRTLDFLPESTSSGQPPVPALLRGLYALHAAYGHRRWEEALGAAESLAATGVPVSATLAADIRADAARLRADPGLRALFFGAAGQPLAEGETLVQADLAATLRSVRQHGVGTFYSTALSGGVAAQVAEGSGGDPQRLAGYQAQWRGTSDIESGNNLLHFPVRRAGGDDGLGGAWKAAVAAGDGAWLGALVGALGPQAGAAVAPGAVFSVVDPYNQAVACVLTLGGRFGAGRLIPETGVVVAGSAGGAGIGGPALVVNHHQWNTLFAGAASGGAVGGAVAEASLLAVLHAALIEEREGPAVVAAPRAAPVGGGVLAEAGVPTAALGALAGGMRMTDSLGRVEAVACRYNGRDGSQRCEAAVDPRSPGLHFTVLK